MPTLGDLLAAEIKRVLGHSGLDAAWQRVRTYSQGMRQG
jgi:ABC-type multidrug transport system ATPase subunit